MTQEQLAQSFGDSVRECRLARNLTQQQLANPVRLHPHDCHTD